MSDKWLIVVAGCNGSGKSSFSKLFMPPAVIPFDYDIHLLKIYAALFDSDIREVMAHNMAFAELENQIGLAIANGVTFCYETNFNSTPLHWPSYFKKNGYKLHLIFLCLNSTDEAKRRVNIRVENGGHFVSADEIVKRYFEGFANLNEHFSYFDTVDIFDTSAYGEEPKYILSLEHEQIASNKNIPEYMVSLIPAIVAKASKQL